MLEYHVFFEVGTIHFLEHYFDDLKREKCSRFSLKKTLHKNSVIYIFQPQAISMRFFTIVNVRNSLIKKRWIKNKIILCENVLYTKFSSV